MPDSLRRWATRFGPATDGPPDAELLTRYVTVGESDALALLVARHGPMVWGVCRRVLGHHPDAEDAFQAAFLVLLRRAADVRHRDRFAGWLYGVAYRTAVHARKVRAKQQRRSATGFELADLPAREPDASTELPGLVERELAALPEKFRAAVALCDLDGRSREDAARLLGIPEGTLSSRLHTARRRLAARLRRYSAGALTAVAVPAHAVPWGLVDGAVRAAVSGGSSAVSSLVLGVCRAMSFKTKLVACVSVAVLLAGSVGTIALFSNVTAGNPPAAKPIPPVAQPQPVVFREDGPGTKKVADAPPVVLKTEPAAGSETVDPGLKEIRVTFSKPMADKSWSWATDTRFGADIDGDNIRYDKDKKTCVMDVKLKPDTTYAVWLNSEKFTNFKDADGTPSLPYLLVFRTGKAK